MAAPDIGSCLSAGIDGFKKNPLAHILAVVLIDVAARRVLRRCAAAGPIIDALTAHDQAAKLAEMEG